MRRPASPTAFEPRQDRPARSKAVALCLGLGLALASWEAPASRASEPPPRASTIFRDPAVADMADSLARGDPTAALRARAAKADMNARGAQGVRPIHYVASYAHELSLDSLRALVGAGADLEAVDDLGRTPLGIASARPGGQAVQILLNAGAKPHATSAGVMPALIAARSGNSSGFQLLALSGTPPTGPMYPSGSLAGELAAAGLFEPLAWIAERGLYAPRSLDPAFWRALCSGTSAAARSAAKAMAPKGSPPPCR